MRHIYDTKFDVHKIAETVNNLPEVYIDMLYMSLVSDVDHIIVDSSLSLEEACQEAIEAKTFTIFEWAIILTDVYKVYEAKESGMDPNDTFDCLGDYLEHDAIQKLMSMWKIENPEEAR